MQNSTRFLPTQRRRLWVWCLLCLCLFSRTGYAANLSETIAHGYVDNQGVSLHYVTQGSGPLVVLLHGFPDFWYTWRDLIPLLAENYQVVAMDLRGYNLSDKPSGVENYRMGVLISDVVAVIKQQADKAAVLVGHDWGGAIAWQVAMNQPDVVDKLIVLSTPHPAGLSRELSNNTRQQENSQYALDFQSAAAKLQVTEEFFTSWVKDPAAREYYAEAYAHSDVEAMLNYYKASFPQVGQASVAAPRIPAQPRKVKASTLAIFGVEDKQLLPAGFNNTWEYVDAELTLVAVPGAGHFVQHDAPDTVLRTIMGWLAK